MYTVHCTVYIVQRKKDVLANSHLICLLIKNLHYPHYHHYPPLTPITFHYIQVNLGYGMYRGEKLYSVSADSHGTVDGVACGTSIRAWVRGDQLTTVNQTHTEYVKVNGWLIYRCSCLCTFRLTI